MKKIIIISLIFFVLSCEKDNSLIDDGTVIWKPNPVATITDSQIQLNWLNYSIYNMVLLPYTYVNPDNFEIYISEGTPNNFTKLIEVENDESYSYQVANLENSQSYYFYVVSKKRRYSSLVSDTIMAIPNPQPQTENLIKVDNSHTITSVSLAPGKNKIAYVTNSIHGTEGELLYGSSYFNFKSGWLGN